MMKDLRRRYCIVGVRNTRYGQPPEYSQSALNVLAVRNALEDARLTTRDLDGVLTDASTPTSSMSAVTRNEELRYTLRVATMPAHSLPHGEAHGLEAQR